MYIMYLTLEKRLQRYYFFVKTRLFYKKLNMNTLYDFSIYRISFVV